VIMGKLDGKVAVITGGSSGMPLAGCQLAIGLVLAITPLTAVNLSAVERAHSGIAAAIQNAVGRTTALIAVACVGLIAAGTLTDASFERLLQLSAVLFFIGAVISGATIINPTAPAEPVPG
jgi:NAD(P)-dependent dehydrogenase (short-subunit alcohol dehydrogenase family)